MIKKTLEIFKSTMNLSLTAMGLYMWNYFVYNFLKGYFVSNLQKKNYKIISITFEWKKKILLTFDVLTNFYIVECEHFDPIQLLSMVPS